MGARWYASRAEHLAEAKRHGLNCGDAMLSVAQQPTHELVELWESNARRYAMQAAHEAHLAAIAREACLRLEHALTHVCRPGADGGRVPTAGAVAVLVDALARCSGRAAY